MYHGSSLYLLPVTTNKYTTTTGHCCTCTLWSNYFFIKCYRINSLICNTTSTNSTLSSISFNLRPILFNCLLSYVFKFTNSVTMACNNFNKALKENKQHKKNNPKRTSVYYFFAPFTTAPHRTTQPSQVLP